MKVTKNKNKYTLSNLTTDDLKEFYLAFKDTKKGDLIRQCLIDTLEEEAETEGFTTQEYVDNFLND